MWQSDGFKLYIWVTAKLRRNVGSNSKIHPMDLKLIFEELLGYPGRNNALLSAASLNIL